MACYTPNIIIVKKYQGLSGEIERKTVKFINHLNIKDYERYTQKGGYWEGKYYYEPIKVACGICIGCRIRKSQEWAQRCQLESKKYKHNYFVTLTYNESEKPKYEQDEKGRYIQPDKATKIYEPKEGTWNAPLDKKDLQDFMKRLRRHQEYYNKQDLKENPIRYYASGEYGTSDTKRPHYHAIIFNLEGLDDIYPIYKNEKTNTWVSSSLTLEKIWGKGHVTIDEVNEATINYTCKYTGKKLLFGEFKKEEYYKDGQTPEFTLMSRKPGIAREYYDKNKDKIYLNDEIILKTKAKQEKPRASQPNRYFDKLYELDDPGKMEQIKKARQQKAKELEKSKKSRTSLPEKEQLYIEHKRAYMNLFRKEGLIQDDLLKRSNE